MRIFNYIQVNDLVWILRKAYGNANLYSIVVWDLNTGKYDELPIEFELK